MNRFSRITLLLSFVALLLWGSAALANMEDLENTLIWNLREEEATVFDGGQSEALEEGLLVTLNKANWSSSLRFDLKDDFGQALFWHATLDIAKLSKGASAALVLGNSRVGIVFTADAQGQAALGVETAEQRDDDYKMQVVRTFQLPKQKENFKLELIVDIKQESCRGLIAGKEVFSVSLPYNGIPAIASINRAEVVTLSAESHRKTTALYTTLSILAK